MHDSYLVTLVQFALLRGRHSGLILGPASSSRFVDSGLCSLLKSQSFQDFVTTPTSCYSGNNSHRHVPPAKVNIKADWLSVWCSIHYSLFTPPDDLWTYPILALCQCSLVKFQKFGGLRYQPPVDSTDTPFVCLSPLKHQRVNLLTLLDLQRNVY
jgi:hypothetical protein